MLQLSLFAYLYRMSGKTRLNKKTTHFTDVQCKYMHVCGIHFQTALAPANLSGMEFIFHHQEAC